MMVSSAKAILNTAHNSLVFQRRIRVLVGHLAAEIPRNARVLDVGTGDGSIAASIMRARKDIIIDGLDVMVRPSTKIPVARFDGTHIPAADESYDCVMMVDVLHHTLDPAALVREAARVSRHTVLIKDHLLTGLAAGPTLRLMDWIGNRGHDVALPCNYLAQGDWQRIFREIYLKVEHSIEKLNLYPVPLTWLFDRRLHAIWRLGKIGS
jgi:ubiquinone/menaquinone biosynthesis C-methylase UbiE